MQVGIIIVLAALAGGELDTSPTRAPRLAGSVTLLGLYPLAVLPLGIRWFSYLLPWTRRRARAVRAAR